METACDDASDAAEKMDVVVSELACEDPRRVAISEFDVLIRKLGMHLARPLLSEVYRSLGGEAGVFHVDDLAILPDSYPALFATMYRRCVDLKDDARQRSIINERLQGQQALALRRDELGRKLSRAAKKRELLEAHAAALTGGLLQHAEAEETLRDDMRAAVAAVKASQLRVAELKQRMDDRRGHELRLMQVLEDRKSEITSMKKKHGEAVASAEEADAHVQEIERSLARAVKERDRRASVAGHLQAALREADAGLTKIEDELSRPDSPLNGAAAALGAAEADERAALEARERCAARISDADEEKTEQKALQGSVDRQLSDLVQEALRLAEEHERVQATAVEWEDIVEELEDANAEWRALRKSTADQDLSILERELRLRLERQRASLSPGATTTRRHSRAADDAAQQRSALKPISANLPAGAGKPGKPSAASPGQAAKPPGGYRARKEPFDPSQPLPSNMWGDESADLLPHAHPPEPHGWGHPRRPAAAPAAVQQHSSAASRWDGSSSEVADAAAAAAAARKARAGGGCSPLCLPAAVRRQSPKPPSPETRQTRESVPRSDRSCEDSQAEADELEVRMRETRRRMRRRASNLLTHEAPAPQAAARTDRISPVLSRPEWDDVLPAGGGSEDGRRRASNLLTHRATASQAAARISPVLSRPEWDSSGREEARRRGAGTSSPVSLRPHEATAQPVDPPHARAGRVSPVLSRPEWDSSGREEARRRGAGTSSPVSLRPHEATAQPVDPPHARAGRVSPAVSKPESRQSRSLSRSVGDFIARIRAEAGAPFFAGGGGSSRLSPRAVPDGRVPGKAGSEGRLSPAGGGAMRDRGLERAQSDDVLHPGRSRVSEGSPVSRVTKHTVALRARAASRNELRLQQKDEVVGREEVRRRQRVQKASLSPAPCYLTSYPGTPPIVPIIL
ncbi:hypothetical protein DIPPA_24409 [Diplonema papillatum]|nr:hypothetical protein DIPPA_24409 [Diplonema papillatum]